MADPMELDHGHDVFSIYSNSNPLNISEILAAVLKFIEPAKNDLLNCRLVNQLWNAQVVQILQAKGCRLTLDESNLVKYKTLLRKAKFRRQLGQGAARRAEWKQRRSRKKCGESTTSTKSKMQAPSTSRRILYSTNYLHLYTKNSKSKSQDSSEISVPIASLELSLNLNKTSLNHHLEENELLAEAMDLLAQNPHLRVVVLQYAPCNSGHGDGDGDDDDDDDLDRRERFRNDNVLTALLKAKEVQLNQILLHSFPTLRSLGLDTYFLSCDSISGTIRANASELLHLSSFYIVLNDASKFKHTDYNGHDDYDDYYLGFNLILGLLQSAPNLISFGSIGGYSTSFLKKLGEQSIDKLEVLLVLNRILELHVDAEASDLSTLQFGQCKTFKLVQEQPLISLPTFGSFVLTKCPRLEQIELHCNPFRPASRAGILVQQLLLSQLVPCPNVNSLCIYYNSTYNDSGSVELGLNGKQILYSLIAARLSFPNLVSITLDLDSSYYLSTVYSRRCRTLLGIPAQHNDDESQGCPNVINFKVLIPTDFSVAEDMVHEDGAAMLQTFFPNVLHLWMDVKVLEIEDDEDELELIEVYEEIEAQSKAILFFLNHFGSKMERLQIDNYYHDWLGEIYAKVVNRPNPDNNVFPELKILSLTRNVKNPIQSTSADASSTGFNTTTTTTEKSGLTCLLESNPQLELLEIDSQLFRYGDATSTSQEKSLQHLFEHRKVTNPNLTIKFV